MQLLYGVNVGGGPEFKQRGARTRAAVLLGGTVAASGSGAPFVHISWRFLVD